MATSHAGWLEDVPRADGLPVVYLLWACVVLILYPLCRWYAAVKQRRTDAWLSYL